MNSNILVEYKPQVIVKTDSLLSSETKKFFHNKQISVCKNKQHKQNFFGFSATTFAEKYLGRSIKGRRICEDCSYKMTAKQAKHLRRQIMKREKNNNLPCLQQEKLLAYGNKMLNRAKVFSGGSWGCITIEDAAIKLLENPRNNLEATHPGYQAAKYLYSQAQQHKVEYLMRHGVISLSSIDNHISNLKNSLHCIVENDGDTKLNSEVAITANDCLNHNQEIKYLLGKLYILKAILNLQEEPTTENTFEDKVENSLTYIREADNLIDAEFLNLMKAYFSILKNYRHEVTSDLRQNLATYRLEIKQLKNKIDNAFHDPKNIKKHEYKNIEKQYLENSYAYFFTLLILTKISTDNDNLSNEAYMFSDIKDQLHSKLRSYTEKEASHTSVSNSKDYNNSISDDSYSSFGENSSDDELCSSN